MALTLSISDGTLTVSLVDAAGFAVSDWTPGAPPPTVQEFTSPLTDGTFLRSISRPNVIERITGRIKGTSHDNLAAQVQDLKTLLRKAERLHTFDPQTTPVYLTDQTTNETGSRKGLIFWGYIEPGADRLKPPFRTGNFWRDVQLILSREPFWRDQAPGTIPSALTFQQADAPATGTEMYVNNCRETATIDRIFTFDDSAASFSADLKASSAFKYFPDPVGVSDILYIGCADPFRDVAFFVGTLRTGTATLVWEYWSGAAWTTLIGGATGEDGTNTFQGTNSSTGRYTVKIRNPTGWALTTVNGRSDFWIRCRISAFTSMPAIPEQSTQVVYVAENPKVTVASTVLNGDVDALLRLFLDSKAVDGSTVTYGIFWLAAGLKTRGLTAFTSHLNFGGANPSGWSVANGTDTSSVADILSPSGNRLACTFAGSQALVRRATITNSTAATVKDWIGSYRVFLRCNQITGSAGDVTVQLRIVLNGASFGVSGVEWQSEQKKLQRVYVSGPTQEVVDFGLVQMPFLSRGRSLSTVNTDSLTQLDFGLYASALSATPDLYLYDLVLLPADEMMIGAEVPTLTGDEEQSIQHDSGLEMDGGLVGYDVQLVSNYTGAPGSRTAIRTVQSWLPTAPPPSFPPDTEGALFFLFGDAGSAPYLSSAGLGAHLQMFAHQRWEQLRGAD